MHLCEMPRTAAAAAAAAAAAVFSVPTAHHEMSLQGCVERTAFRFCGTAFHKGQ
jgi:hypothetical protein